MKNKFGFILVKPQLGENIGACARSLKNFGFSKLHIVSPKQSLPNNKSKATSVGAYDIVKKAKIYNNTFDAIGEFDIVISLSARKRDINKKHISINEFIKIVSSKKILNSALCLVRRHQDCQMKIYPYQIMFCKFQLQKNLNQLIYHIL